jgi:hypothetical protein
VPQEESAKGGRPSFGEMLWAFFGVLLVALFALLLFILFGDRPFGIQIATLISYTCAISFFVFSRARWLNRGYSPRYKAVRQEIPCLLGIHCVFLALVFVIQTSASAWRSRLPAYWFTAHGKDPGWFDDVMVLVYTLIGTTQIFISRNILKRALVAESTTSRNGASKAVP